MTLVFGFVMVAGAAGCATTGTPQPTSGTPITSAAPSSTDGCPVDADTLYQVLRITSEYKDLEPGRLTMERVDCYGGFASAFSVIKDTDSVLWIFRYDPAAKTWTPVTGGTDGTCGGPQVPKEVRAQLDGCRPEL